jgi:hypothetical protein
MWKMHFESSRQFHKYVKEHDYYPTDPHKPAYFPCVVVFQVHDEHVEIMPVYLHELVKRS